MEKDLISIIVPVYNVEKYLESCLESIINQTYKNLEIILVDDGSTDESGNICDKYANKDKRIKVIHKKNGGLSDARNIGIKESTGKYLTFVDSDDYIVNDYVEYLFNLIKKYKTNMSICTYSIVTTSGKHILTNDGFIEQNMKKIKALDCLLCEKGFTVSACAKMYSKDLFKNIEFPVGKLCEDNGTTYKLIDKCDYVAYGEKSKYLYFKRDNSIMTSKFNIKKFDLIELVDIMSEELSKYSELQESILKKRISSRFSILRQIVFSDYYNSKYTDEIITFLKENKKFIFNSKKIDKREKIALLLLLISKRFFKFSWSIYTKIKY